MRRELPFRARNVPSRRNIPRIDSVQEPQMKHGFYENNKFRT